MGDQLIFTYVIDGNDFTRAGEASSSVKNKLKMLGVSSDVIRKTAIAMYEGEINMVIHADGGTITVTISDKDITMVLADTSLRIQVPASPTSSRPCRKDSPLPGKKCAPSASGRGWGFRI